MKALDEAWLSDHPLAAPDADTNKNERGRVVVVGGSRFVPGALRLTGEAALRAGAGKLQLGTIGEAALLLGMFVPEAGVFGLSADEAGELDVSAADEVVDHARSCDAIVLGPGMRSSDSCAELVGQIVSALPPDIALLLDAAAIAACRHCREVIKGHAGPVVLTPHHGEMAALLDTDINDIEHMPEAAACKAASELDAVVVLKAAETIIAAPGETSLCFAGGSPGLATGGSGDVLAGILGGLLARGIAPRTAAGRAVWAHGQCGRHLTASFHGLGLLGRELLDLVPSALNASAGGGASDVQTPAR
jgi:hydroxyethylthiazole kinase-like uncharacterized protein yjeF